MRQVEESRKPSVSGPRYEPGTSRVLVRQETLGRSVMLAGVVSPTQVEQAEGHALS
jgi:hypothetical protein